jgi:hypothetical protein
MNALWGVGSCASSGRDQAPRLLTGGTAGCAVKTNDPPAKPASKSDFHTKVFLTDLEAKPVKATREWTCIIHQIAFQTFNQTRAAYFPSVAPLQ